MSAQFLERWMIGKLNLLAECSFRSQRPVHAEAYTFEKGTGTGTAMGWNSSPQLLESSRKNTPGDLETYGTCWGTTSAGQTQCTSPWTYFHTTRCSSGTQRRKSCQPSRRYTLGQEGVWRHLSWASDVSLTLSSQPTISSLLMLLRRFSDAVWYFSSAAWSQPSDSTTFRALQWRASSTADAWCCWGAFYTCEIIKTRFLKYMVRLGDSSGRMEKKGKTLIFWSL